MASTTSGHDFFSSAAYHFEQNRVFIPMYLHLLVAALFPIYTGAHASLSRPSSAAKPTKDDTQSEDEDDEEETIQKMEGLTPKDAIVFPITAGLVLAGLYWLIKTYGAGIINTVLGLYFSLIGTYSVAKMVNDSWTTIAGFIMPTYYSDQGRLWKVHNIERTVQAVGEETESRTSPLAGFLGKVPLPEPLLSTAWALRDVVKQRFSVKGYAKDLFDFKAILTRHNVASSILGVAVISYSIFVDKPWWLTNLQGFAVSYGALQLMSPTTFGTGTLILSGLFFYDIWAVFFTPLMVTVAKNLDVPIKLLFPRPDVPSATPGEKPARSYSMLGLGDIVLPGLMIALALRYDLYMYYLRKQKKVQKCSGAVCTMEFERIPYVSVTGRFGDKFWTRRSRQQLPAQLSTSFPKPYFTASMVGYVIGMIATLVFMSVFQHAQPALLYLVPGVLISLWGTGLVRGELQEMWQFTEAITGDAIEDDDKAKAEQKLSKGIFIDLWEEIFGSVEASKDKNSDESKADGENEIDAEDKKATDSDTVFSLSITHHKKSKKDGQTSQVRDEGKNKSREDSSASSDSVDDAVLVSSSDVQESEEVSQTKLRISTQDGTAEKHRRLD